MYDESRRRALADIYRAGSGAKPADAADGSSPLQRSARFLYDNMHRVPVLVVPCIAESAAPVGWGPSIYPAVWSLMLALRSGLGCA